MIQKIGIKNYKSIVEDEIELGRINVFIGENGAGKSNILEAVAMFSAQLQSDLSIDNIYNKGVRVTNPNITFSSYAKRKNYDYFKVVLKLSEIEELDLEFSSKSEKGIYFKWIAGSTKMVKSFMRMRQYERDLRLNITLFNMVSDGEILDLNYDKINKKELEKLFRLKGQEILSNTFPKRKLSKKERKDLEQGSQQFMKKTNNVSKVLEKEINEVKEYLNPYIDFTKEYSIYNLSTLALRGINSNSRLQHLGINGEGLDILISTFSKDEMNLLKEHSYFISWLKEVMVDEQDLLKFKGHKLNRSISRLYFKDQYMKRTNNVFAAENANEGALYVLFYLALFISKKTPSFFAIDNIETALNPKLCRELMKSIAALSKKTNKQALITTHNPAILDGINLNDDDQRLFVVSRTDEGHTKTRRIKLKPKTGKLKYKLSELWMNGDLGGIPNNFL